MAVRSKVGTVARWATWPVLIIIALNIEDAASHAGYGTIISEHWKESVPVLKTLYEIAVSPWLIYPALILLGAVMYEWIVHTISRAELDGGPFQRWLIKWNSDALATAFLKKGAFRKLAKPEELQRMSRRLIACGLAPIPEAFSPDEALNRVYGSYLLLLSKGQFEHAGEFIEAKADFIRTASAEAT